MHILAIALTYVLVHGSHNMISGSAVGIETAVAKRAAYGQDFIWFRLHGKEYVIRDRATLERIGHLFDAERAMDPDAERIHAELRPLEHRESELDRQMDAITDREDDEQLTAADEEKLDRLRHEMDAIRPKMRELERREEEVDRKRDAAEAEGERRMVPILDDAIRNGVAEPQS